MLGFFCIALMSARVATVGAFATTWAGQPRFQESLPSQKLLMFVHTSARSPKMRQNSMDAAAHRFNLLQSRLVRNRRSVSPARGSKKLTKRVSTATWGAKGPRWCHVPGQGPRQCKTSIFPFEHKRQTCKYRASSRSQWHVSCRAAHQTPRTEKIPSTIEVLLTGPIVPSLVH